MSYIGPFSDPLRWLRGACVRSHHCGRRKKGRRLYEHARL